MPRLGNCCFARRRATSRSKSTTWVKGGWSLSSSRPTVRTAKNTWPESNRFSPPPARTGSRLKLSRPPLETRTAFPNPITTSLKRANRQREPLCRRREIHCEERLRRSAALRADFHSVMKTNHTHPRLVLAPPGAEFVIFRMAPALMGAATCPPCALGSSFPPFR